MPGRRLQLALAQPLYDQPVRGGEKQSFAAGNVDGTGGPRRGKSVQRNWRSMPASRGATGGLKQLVGRVLKTVSVAQATRTKLVALFRRLSCCESGKG